MSLFYQHNINGSTKLGVWRIEEPESFFLERVPQKKNVSHPYKRLQHLAGRYLLPVLFNDFPLEEILIADTRKPFLENERYHFSISHCGNFAAAIISSEHRVGVDIEMVTPRIVSISNKFLNENEKRLLQNWEQISQLHLELTTVLWSAKESIFKWHSLGDVDFKKHIRLNGPVNMKASEWIDLPFVFDKGQPVNLHVKAKRFGTMVLAWVVS